MIDRFFGSNFTLLHEWIKCYCQVVLLEPVIKCHQPLLSDSCNCEGVSEFATSNLPARSFHLSRSSHWRLSTFVRFERSASKMSLILFMTVFLTFSFSWNFSSMSLCSRSSLFSHVSLSSLLIWKMTSWHTFALCCQTVFNYINIGVLGVLDPWLSVYENWKKNNRNKFIFYTIDEQ